ncbi:MAG: VF530 family DNA-binding protein [Propionivibrio sp.]|nr:VF530 family DNA-binding protein [Propionivibrio sp.]
MRANRCAAVGQEKLLRRTPWVREKVEFLY